MSDADTKRTIDFAPVDPNWELLYEYARQLGPDELRVLVTLASRLVAGKAVYGDLRIDTDRRNWEREAFEEVADALNYVAIKLDLLSLLKR